MRELLDFLLKNILPGIEYEILEDDIDGKVIYTVKTPQENIGLIIGKGGKMIKALRNILKVRATLEKKAVSLEVSEA